MGIYDRDYYRDDKNDGRPRRKRSNGSGGLIPADWSASAMLIAANILLFFVNSASGDALFNKMALFGLVADQPAQWYRCLTYGFAHDPSGLTHLLFNMLALFIFGPSVERRIGRGEFTLFYFAAVLVGGVVWSVGNVGANAVCLGASGAITAVALLFAFYCPYERILLFAIIPIPAWLAGLFWVLIDIYGMQNSRQHYAAETLIAYDVHLAGAAFALVYYLAGVNFSELAVGKGRNRKSLKRWLEKRERARKDAASGPSTVPFNRDAAKKAADEIAFEKLEAEVDRLLLKISESGEESLTEVERETLRRASREYQKRQK